MVTYNGKGYERDSRGKYRCPQRCGHPDYPQPSWTTEKGFLKHLESCQGALTWTPEPKEGRVKYGDCEDCGAVIWMFSSVWEMRDRTICIDCYRPYFEAGVGFHSSAGLVLPHIVLQV